MAVVQDGVVGTVGLLDLIEGLGDEKALQSVTGHESQRRFEEVEAPQSRKLVEHEQQPVPPPLGVKLFR